MKNLILWAAFLPALLAGCTDNQSLNNYPNHQGLNGAVESELASVIRVTDFEDKAIAGAQVLIGDANNVPFSGNFLTADSQGRVEIPAAWESAQSITVGAKGYVRVTYINQLPGPLTFKLAKVISTAHYEVRGTVTGLPIKDFDKQVDYGIVLPAMTKLNSLLFDMNQFISPILDSVSTLGQQMAIPSNISVPWQKERYAIMTATLNKPQYRIYFEEKGIVRLYALRGRFEFSPVVGALRKGKSFVDVLNMFTLTGSGMRDVNITNASTANDLPINEVTFTQKKKATAPAIKTDETFIAVATNFQSGYLVPTDLKNVASGQSAELSLHNKGSNFLLGVLKKTVDLDQGPTFVVDSEFAAGSNPMSTTIIPFTGSVTAKVLPLITGPKLSNTGDLILPKVSTISGVTALATYSVFSQMFEDNRGGTKVLVPKRLWEVYAADWTTNIKLPEWPNDANVPGKKRWETSFLGGPQSASQDKLGPAIIEAATHATHSEYNF